MRLLVTLPLAAAVLVGLPTPSQDPAAFSGRWVYAYDRSPTNQRANFGAEFQLTMDGKTMKVERVNAGQTVVTVYPLDESEFEQKTGQSVTKTRARFDKGQILMAVSTTSAPDSAGLVGVTNSTRRLWIEGDSLISEWIVAPPVNVTIISVYKRPTAPAAPKPPARTTIASMGWLVGNWESKAGTTTTEERWTPAAAGAMLGVSRTIVGERMAAFEFLRIIERDGTLIYVAQPNGRSPATEFTLTKLDANSAVFENPTHDYPKVITYTLAADGTLTAVISDAGGLKPQMFTFRKTP